MKLPISSLSSVIVLLFQVPSITSYLRRNHPASLSTDTQRQSRGQGSRQHSRRRTGNDPPWKQRYHVSRGLSFTDELRDTPIRLGSCSQVPYGNLELATRVDLASLPLTQLMIELDKPSIVMPPNPNGATIVDIGLYITEITEVDPGENSFFMEGYLDLVWCDPRERFDAEQENLTTKFFLEKNAEKEMSYIWWPDIVFVNELIPRRTENEELFIAHDGTVEYREKFGVRLASNYFMQQFPFDTQTLVAEIESFAWPSDVLQFHIEEDIVGFSDEFDIPEYEIVGVEEHLEERMEVRDRHPFSELVAEIHVKRIPTYYVTKVIVPLTLIVCISWAVFWMKPDALADRMSISFTGVLTSVAYQFIVSESLPRHIYNTFLDNFVLFSFAMMVLTILENIIVKLLHGEEEGKGERSRKLDVTCRVVFPLMFTTGVAILAGVQLPD
eukprot:scaffold9946_cov188-Amphora_coffeaeformis.AAC.11